MLGKKTARGGVDKATLIGGGDVVKSVRFRKLLARLAARGGIVLFFVMALEVMIMISPFAFFFYSVFNPVFNWLDRYAATRWLTAFFLPHMILPPTLFLKSVRVLGSALFLVGMATFVICALQVYLGKLFRRGVATGGLYHLLRHPQYLALGTWGVGMSILWPRFIVLAFLAIMFILYYFLAGDEEARMRLRHGDAYEQYARRTGRFFPRPVERAFAFIGRLAPLSVPAAVRTPALILCIVIGAGFLCRAVTLSSLRFESKANVTLVAILPEDSALSANVLDGLLRGAAEGKAGRLQADRDYLGYVMPVDYVMQGMIADTGLESHLYMHHQTVAMITDWVLHPFEHLRRPPSVQMAQMHNVDPSAARRHHCPLGMDREDLRCETCPYRRVILVEVTRPGGTRCSGSELLSFDAARVPVEVVDINAETGDIVKVTNVGRSTAWKDVPTPAI
jgi:protein-S-isoprenylcysteine O-methyltransferase Ste14